MTPVLRVGVRASPLSAWQARHAIEKHAADAIITNFAVDAAPTLRRTEHGGA
jgi:hypothetical protein